MYQLYEGDCLKIVPQLDATIDAVITDPPYGCKSQTNYGATAGLMGAREMTLNPNSRR